MPSKTSDLGPEEIKTLFANVESFPLKLQHQKRGGISNGASNFFVDFCGSHCVIFRNDPNQQLFCEMAGQTGQSDNTIKAAMCEGAHKLDQGSELAVLYPHTGVKRNCVQRDAWFVLRKMTRQARFAWRTKNMRTTKINGSDDDCLSAHWTTANLNRQVRLEAGSFVLRVPPQSLGCQLDI